MERLMSSTTLRIAVTGASGRVGSSVVRYLHERGHTMTRIDRRPLADMPGRFVYMDLRQRELLQPVLETVDALVHLGELPHANIEPDELTFAHNTAVAATVLTTAADLKLRHIAYASSCQVYGVFGNPKVPPLRLPMDEDHPLQPTNAYGLSKASNESYCRFVNRTRGANVSIFRMPVVLGSGQWGVKWVMKGLVRDPLHRYEAMGTYVHVSDVCTAVEAMLIRNLPGCHTYNLAATDVLCRYDQRSNYSTDFPDWPPLPADWQRDQSILSIERARNDLGWQPTWDLKADFERETGQQWATDTPAQPAVTV